MENKQKSLKWLVEEQDGNGIEPAIALAEIKRKRGLLLLTPSETRLGYSLRTAIRASSVKDTAPDIAIGALMRITGLSDEMAAEYWDNAVEAGAAREAVVDIHLRAVEAQNESQLRQIATEGRKALADYRNCIHRLKAPPIKAENLPQHIQQKKAVKIEELKTEGIEELVQNAITAESNNADFAEKEKAEGALTYVMLQYSYRKTPISVMREFFNWIEQSPQRALEVFQLYNADIAKTPKDSPLPLIGFYSAERRGLLEMFVEYAAKEGRTISEVLLESDKNPSGEKLRDEVLVEKLEIAKATPPEERARIWTIMTQHPIVAAAYERAGSIRAARDKYSAAVLNDAQLPEILQKPETEAMVYLKDLATARQTKTENGTNTTAPAHRQRSEADKNGNPPRPSALETTLMKDAEKTLNELGQGNKLREMMQTIPQYAARFAQDVEELKRHPILLEILKAPQLWRTYRKWRTATEEPLATAICHINPFENPATQINQLRSYLEKP